MSQLNPNDHILITGGTGLIGTNLAFHLQARGYKVDAIGSAYDLRSPDRTAEAFETFKPDVVFHLAAKVGGILANNTYKSDFYSDNVLINTHVINACLAHGIGYVFAMGTGCAYPKRLENDLLQEKDYLDGTPEVTNDAYAYAKRGMLVHLDALQKEGRLNYTYCLPANIYGPHDNFHPTHSHVVAALVRRFYEAAEANAPSVAVWGDGSASRDFLFIDDCVDAMHLLAAKGHTGPVNVATGELTSIRTLVETLIEVVGYKGEVTFDTSFPEGQKRRLMSMQIMKSYDWRPSSSLADGLTRTVEWFANNRDRLAER